MKHFILHVYIEDCNGMVTDDFDMVLIKTKSDIINYKDFSFNMEKVDKLIPVAYLHEKIDENPSKTVYYNFTFLRIK